MATKLTISRRVNLKAFDGWIAKEKNGKVRKKLRALKLVKEGKSVRQAASRVYLSHQTVGRAVHCFNERGKQGLQDNYRGRVSLLTASEEATFKQRIINGPTKKDAVRIFHGKDAHRILKEEYGVDIHSRTAYKILHRVGLSSLAPRPENPKSKKKKKLSFKKLQNSPKKTEK